jgi:hypothetical protein
MTSKAPKLLQDCANARKMDFSNGLLPECVVETNQILMNKAVKFYDVILTEEEAERIIYGKI